MTRTRQTIWGAVLALGACSGPQGLEKGPLVSLRLDEAKLENAYEPRKFALVVGISDFEDETWRSLRYAAKDAQDVADALKDSRRGNFSKVTLLFRPEDTTRTAVLKAIAELEREATRPDDVVVVYLSAHGTLARDAKGEIRRYLVTRDARYGSIAQTALSVDLLEDEFDRFASKRRLLVLATCHSGNGKSLLPPEIERELSQIKGELYPRPMEESSRAAMVFTACDFGETAREDESLQNDIYTHFWVQGLAGEADRNADGAITATEAHDFARRLTYGFTQGRQRPTAEILEVGADPIVLSGRVDRIGQPELYSYNPRLEGFTLKVDGEAKAELPGGAAVRPGKRKVELTKGGSPLFAEELEVSAGDKVDLDLLVARGSLRRTILLVAGAVGFVDPKSRTEVLPAALTAGFAFRWADVPLPKLSLAMDLSASTGNGRVSLDAGSPAPFRFRLVSAGVTVPYEWAFGRISLLAGPRVAALWVQRSFQLDVYQKDQDYLTLVPGLTGGLVYRLGRQFELAAQAQTLLTYFVVDGRGQALGSVGGWLGAGYRF